MASKLFEGDKTLPYLSLAEMHEVMSRAAGLMNQRRFLQNDIRFATVRVGEILTHPLTRAESFVIQFSDKDEAALKMVNKVERRLARLSDARIELQEDNGTSSIAIRA